MCLLIRFIDILSIILIYHNKYLHINLRTVSTQSVTPNLELDLHSRKISFIYLRLYIYIFLYTNILLFTLVNYLIKYLEKNYRTKIK